MSILDAIIEKTKERVAVEKTTVSEEMLKELESPVRDPYLFEKALEGDEMSFICEVKKASPSKGIISEDFPYLDIATSYEQAGAAAISVLTEPFFFQGRDQYLSEIRKAVDIPILRKDFIIDPYQILQGKKLGADGILLICAVLTKETLKEYLQYADSLGLSCLVEVHDEHELNMALDAKARIIGVNNRNLHTFEVDLMNSIRLRKLAPDTIKFISESGISSRKDIEILLKNRVDGVLIGETLMKHPDKKELLLELKGTPKEDGENE